MAELETNALIRVGALALALAGCGGSEDEDCSRARDFIYDTSFTELAGTCGPYVGFPVHVDGRLSTSIRIVGNTRINAEHVLADCTFRFGQFAHVDGDIVERVVGELPIDADGDGAIRGEVTIQRFDGSSEPTCSSDYDLVLTPRGR
jgi:hypothetical protein